MSETLPHNFKGYRKFADYEYTVLAYRKAKEDGANNLASNIRRANPLIEREFDFVDKQLVLIPVNRPEGWDN